MQDELLYPRRKILGKSSSKYNQFGLARMNSGENGERLGVRVAEE